MLALCLAALSSSHADKNVQVLQVAARERNVRDDLDLALADL